MALCSPSCGSDSIYFNKNAPKVSTLCVGPPVRSCALSNITAPPAIKSRVEMSLIVVFFLSLLLTSEKECDAPCMSFFARGSRHFERKKRLRLLVSQPLLSLTSYLH